MPKPCLVFLLEILWQEVISRQRCMPVAESLLQRSTWSCRPDRRDCRRDGQRGRQLRLLGTWPWSPWRRVPWQGWWCHPLHLWNVPGRRPYDPVWKVHGKSCNAWNAFIVLLAQKGTFSCCTRGCFHLSLCQRGVCILFNLFGQNKADKNIEGNYWSCETTGRLLGKAAFISVGDKAFCSSNGIYACLKAVVLVSAGVAALWLHAAGDWGGALLVWAVWSQACRQGACPFALLFIMALLVVFVGFI